MARLELPDETEVALKVIESELQTKELGWMGKVFGSRFNAPTNIAGGLVAVSVICLLLVGFSTAIDPITKADLLKTFGGMGFAALGYVFGSVSAPRS